MSRPLHRSTALLLGALWAAPALAAEPYAELRAYPSGGIGSIGLLFAADARTELGLSLAYNVAERGDAGEHDDESGEGFGVGIEARRFRGSAPTGWFYGARAELFQLDIDWRDRSRRGSTEITVLQPTARLGYRFALAGRGLSLELAGGLGAEINVQTDGEEVGEGAIGLIGIAIR